MKPTRTRHARRGLLLCLALLALPSLVAQGITAPQAAQAPSEAPSPLPRGFRSLELGLQRPELLARLKADPLFSYRGPEDVSLLASPNESLIEVEGDSFIKRAFFQFYEGRLWVIILELDRSKIDHFSIYSSLRTKYGEPDSLDPREARWEEAGIRLALERPLSLRYLDLGVYERLRSESSAKESFEELERRDFLGEL